MYVMEDGSVRLSGLDLRYLLISHLVEGRGILTVRELAARVESEGFTLRGRATKTVSDALRWEVRRGRVVRHGRGLYGPGSVPRETKSRIRKRVHVLRARLVAPTWDATADDADSAFPMEPLIR